MIVTEFPRAIREIGHTFIPLRDGAKLAARIWLPVDAEQGRTPERWVLVHVTEAYIHCRKHFPKADGAVEWGTDDPRAKGGDYFGAKDTPSPWAP